MPTKTELIKNHKEGRLKDVAVHTLSNVGGIMICHIDDREEKVFGYSVYGQSEIGLKDYFYVKYYTESERPYFKVGKLKIYLDECMRVNNY